MKLSMRRVAFRRAVLLVPVTLGLVAGSVFLGVTAIAGPSESDVPPNWHIHDGQLALGPEHKGISFFPRILGISQAEYLLDPARCPNATDKSFLPSYGESQSDV